MKLLTLEGREYHIQPLDYISNNTIGKSKGHLLARQILKELYPGEWLLEEIPARVGKQTLYVDFIIKRWQIAVEVQGPQHTEFVQHFHGTQAGFRESIARDQQKRMWCETNQFILTELPYGEEDVWRKRLCEAKG